MATGFVREQFLGFTGPVREQDFVLLPNRPRGTVACATERHADAPHGCSGWFCDCPCHHASCACHRRVDLIAGVL